MNFRITLSSRLLAVCSVAALGACTASTPVLDTSDGADVSFDGLAPLKRTRADMAWARPGIDISQYSGIMLQSVGVEYRPGGETGRSFHARSSGGPFEVTEEQKTMFETIMRERFLEELGKSEHFRIVSEPGPDVLLVRGALLDVVSYIPPDPLSARSSIYLSRLGEATLVIELRDSITEAILARAVDRRAAEEAFGMQESTRVKNVSEIRRLATTWARMLRQRLDEFAERG